MLNVQHYSISKKLTWMNMLVSGVALLLACAAFFAYDLYTFRVGIVRNLSTEAQIIGSNTVSALVFNDSHAAENTLSALKASPHIHVRAIYTPDGQTFAGYWRDRRKRLCRFQLFPQRQTQAHWFAGWADRGGPVDRFPRQTNRLCLYPVRFEARSTTA